MSGILQATTMAGDLVYPRIRSVSFAYYNSPSNAICPINKPTGTTEGDLLIMMGGTRHDSTYNREWTGDTDWTEVAEVQSLSYSSGRVAYKVAGASEPTTYTFTSPEVPVNTHTDVFMLCVIAIIDGAYDASTIGVTSGATVGTVTASVNNCLDLNFGHWWVNNTLSTPSGTTRYSFATDSANYWQGLFYKYVNAGATGTLSYSPSSGNSKARCLVKPA